MGRKELRAARARALQRLVERSITDPVGLETDLRRYQFIKGAVLLVILVWMFKEAILFSFGRSFDLQFKLVSNHPQLATLVALLMGVFLYVFRERFKFYYGLVEVSFSAALTYGLLLHLDVNGLAGLAGLLGVVGAIYVTVRGVDNVCTGYRFPRLHHKENPKPDPEPQTDTP